MSCLALSYCILPCPFVSCLVPLYLDLSYCILPTVSCPLIFTHLLHLRVSLLPCFTFLDLSISLLLCPQTGLEALQQEFIETSFEDIADDDSDSDDDGKKDQI